MKQRKQQRLAKAYQETRSLRDQNGRWLIKKHKDKDYAPDWQLERLVAAGYSPDKLRGIRFGVAQQLLSRAAIAAKPTAAVATC